MPLPLLERSEAELARTIRKNVQSIKDVREVAEPRLRLSSKRTRVELSVSLNENLTFERTHEVALRIERVVKKILPKARVIILTEPMQSSLENTWALVKKVVEDIPGTRGVTNIHLQELDHRLAVDVNVEISANSSMKQAYEVSQEVEKRIKTINPTISEVIVHEETAMDRLGREWTEVETELKLYVSHVARRFPEVKKVYGVRVREVGNTLYVTLRCRFDPNLKLRKATKFSSEVERILKGAHPEISRVIIKNIPV